jgi:hypothetical protein
MRFKTVYFRLVPIKSHNVTIGLIAKPACKTARIFCLLADKNALSLGDLSLIENIGFYVRFSYDENASG